MRRTVGGRASSGRTKIISMRQVDKLTSRGLTGIASEKPASKVHGSDRVRESTSVTKRAGLAVTADVNDVGVIWVRHNGKVNVALSPGDAFRSTRGWAFAATGVQSNVRPVLVRFWTVHLSPGGTAIRRSKKARHRTSVNDSGIDFVAATNRNLQIAGVVGDQCIHCRRADFRPCRPGIHRLVNTVRTANAS